TSATPLPTTATDSRAPACRGRRRRRGRDPPPAPDTWRPAVRIELPRPSTRTARTLCADRIEDGDQIVHEVLQRRKLEPRVTVRAALPAAIDDDQACERRELAEKRSIGRALEQHFEIADDGDIDEVDRPGADDRVADCDVAVPCERDIHRCHGRSISDAGDR